MSHIKYISLVVSAGVISGCQSLFLGDIETMPPTAALPEVSEPGWVELRYFDNIPGNSLSDLDGVAKYPDNPDTVLELAELELAELELAELELTEQELAEMEVAEMKINTA